MGSCHRMRSNIRGGAGRSGWGPGDIRWIESKWQGHRSLQLFTICSTLPVAKRQAEASKGKAYAKDGGQRSADPNQPPGQRFSPAVTDRGPVFPILDCRGGDRWRRRGCHEPLSFSVANGPAATSGSATCAFARSRRCQRNAPAARYPAAVAARFLPAVAHRLAVSSSVAAAVQSPAHARGSCRVSVAALQRFPQRDGVVVGGDRRRRPVSGRG
jgi:hypothetical protein